MRLTFSVIFLALLSANSFAANLSFTGNFTQDDNVQLIPFVVNTSATVTLRTWSYAGGTNAAGSVIPQGGFDPYLALFNSSGQLIAENDDGAGVPTSPVTGEAFDALIQQVLAPGSYTLALTQFDNFANGPTLSDGFLEQGAGNYTVAFGCSNGRFCDIDGNNRTSFWAVDLLNVGSSTVVPEPTSFALCGGAILAGIWTIRRRSHSS